MQFLKRPLKAALSCAGIISSSFFISNAFAGGFQLWEQDASGTGDYHAGAAAEGNTAASEFYNPASITRLKKAQVSGGGTLIGIDVNYSGTVNPPSSTRVVDAPGGTVNFVPNLHFATPLSRRWFFSFGVTTPFGLETNYPDQSPVNVLATKTKLLTINMNPSVAYIVNKYLSVGVGLDVLYGEADYDADVFGPLTSKLSGWNAGYNAGALIQLSPNTRMGVSYRSQITIDAKGTSESKSFSDDVEKTSAKFPLPPTTTLSIFHQFNDKFSVMGSVFYTQWSVFKKLVLNNLASPLGPGTLTLLENYRDTWNFALGGKYRLTRYLSLETGFGYDETPTRLGYRDIRLPGSNRWAASLGVNITPVKGFYWSMGWTHFFIPTTPIDNTKSNDPSNTNINAATTIGDAKGGVDVFGVQLSCDV